MPQKYPGSTDSDKITLCDQATQLKLVNGEVVEKPRTEPERELKVSFEGAIPLPYPKEAIEDYPRDIAGVLHKVEDDKSPEAQLAAQGLEYKDGRVRRKPRKGKPGCMHDPVPTDEDNEDPEYVINGIHYEELTKPHGNLSFDYPSRYSWDFENDDPMPPSTEQARKLIRS